MNFNLRTSLAAAAGLLLAVVASPAAAAVVPAGFTDRLVANTGAYGNYGGVGTDATGNIYVVGGFGPAIKVDSSGTVSTFSSNSLGLAISVVGSEVYIAGESGALTRYSTAGGTGTNVATINNTAVAIASIGTNLYVSTVSGVTAYDLAAGTMATITSGGFQPSSLAVTNNGRLLIGNYFSGNISSYDPVSGTTSAFGQVFNVAGLAVHTPTGDVYAVNDSAQEIYRLSADGLTSSLFASDTGGDAGWYPQGIAFSADQTSLYYLGRGQSYEAQLRAIDGFSAAVADVPEPGTVALLGLGILGLALRRRRQR